MIGGISLGYDSLLACCAAGMGRPTRVRIGWLATACGLCDAGATTLGQAFPQLPALPVNVSYLGCAILLGLATQYSRRLIWALPVMLCLDNLAGGVGPGHRWAGVAALGLWSAAMALCGFALASLLRRCAEIAFQPARSAAPRS